jgi:hypothetical protein
VVDRADELSCLRLFGIGGRSGIRGERRRCLGDVYDFIWPEHMRSMGKRFPEAAEMLKKHEKDFRGSFVSPFGLGVRNLALVTPGAANAVSFDDDSPGGR